jgi:hypothetical protein
MDTAVHLMDRDTRRFYNRAPMELRKNMCQGSAYAMHEMGLYDYMDGLERIWRSASAAEGDAAAETANRLEALKFESIDIVLSASPSSRYFAITRAKHRAQDAIEGGRAAGGGGATRPGRGAAAARGDGEASAAVRAAREASRELYNTTWVTLLTPGVQSEWI